MHISMLKNVTSILYFMIYKEFIEIFWENSLCFQPGWILEMSVTWVIMQISLWTKLQKLPWNLITNVYSSALHLVNENQSLLWRLLWLYFFGEYCSLSFGFKNVSDMSKWIFVLRPIKTILQWHVLVCNTYSMLIYI